MNDIMMQKIAEVAPDKYAFIVKTAGEVRESPFRDEIVEQLDVIVKKAQVAVPSTLGRFGNAAAGIAAGAATGIAYSLAGDMFESLKRGISKTHNYRSMLKENPDLKDLPAKNVQKAFSTLHRFNPEFAGDPTVAGSFVRRQSQFPEFDTNQLANLIGARKNLADLKKLPIPSKVPWETHEEKALRAAQTHHFHASGEKATKELGYLEPTQKRMEAKEQREVERHPYQLAKDKQDVRHGGALAKQREIEHGWKGEEEKRRVEMHPQQLEQMARQAPLTTLNTAQAMENLTKEIPNPKFDPTSPPGPHNPPTIHEPMSMNDIQSLLTKARHIK